MDVGLTMDDDGSHLVPLVESLLLSAAGGSWQPLLSCFFAASVCMAGAAYRRCWAGFNFACGHTVERGSEQRHQHNLSEIQGCLLL